MISCRGIRQRYGARDVLRIDALDVGDAERLAIVGPNGAGKSTLLRVLAFVETPAEGSITLGGRVIDPREARRRVTLVEQRPFLFHGGVMANVAYGLLSRGVARGEAMRRAGDALALLDAQALADRGTDALSGGEAQRVAAARALACEPDVLLLDEPTSGADRAAHHALYAAIDRVRTRRPLAVCVASHQLEDAYQWADRILALHDGVPVPVTPENLFRVVLPGGAAMQRVNIGGLAIDVVSDRGGPVTLAIPPEEIVLSREPLHSSARNTFTGRITRIAEQGAAMRVTLLAEKAELVALVTRRSFEDLGFSLGGTAVASFKSVAVRVF